MNALPAESEPEGPPRAAVRYTYASGSRPLDGYTIKRGVGSGGFGEVYFALSDAGKEVALKLIRRNLDVELRGVTQCLNLKHQNLVALYDIRIDEHEDRWVVMEYVSGESLEDAIDRHPQGMPVETAMRWFAGIAAGVAYLHDHGIVHRDLKPANIFVDEEIVKIGDYGLSKFISCSRRSGQTGSVGTVHYMAPEIANGRYGREIDTYALGVILYEMLTGHVPFEGESVGEVLMKHLTAEPELDAINEPYRGIVRAAMAKDPDQRISSVAEMLHQLPAGVGPTVLGPNFAPATNGEQHGDGLPDDSPKVAATATASTPWPADHAAEPAEYEEEPILAAVRRGYDQFNRKVKEMQWHDWPLLGRVASLGVLIWFAAVTMGIWLPLSFFLGFCYLIYRGVRALFVQPVRRAKRQAGGESAPVVPVAPVAAADADKAPSEPAKPHARRKKKLNRESRRQRLDNYLAKKTFRERTTELVGSMLLAAVVATIVTLVVGMITQIPQQFELYVWMALVTTFASWAIMVPAKYAEGRVEDQPPMRFIQLLSGTLVGIAAWWLADILIVRLPASREFFSPRHSLMGEVLGWEYRDELRIAFDQGLVHPSVTVYAAYFAFLFVSLAWWRSADSSRDKRVSLSRVVWCGFIASLLPMIWWFPQPIGLVLAAMIAFTIQLSSTWLPPSRRRAIIEQGEV